VLAGCGSCQQYILISTYRPLRAGVRGANGERHQPVMCIALCSARLERFFGVLIEHYAGAFPLWLAPVQAAVPISERTTNTRARSRLS